MPKWYQALVHKSPSKCHWLHKRGEKATFVALFTEKDNYTNLQKNKNKNNKKMRAAKTTISNQFSGIFFLNNNKY